MIELKVVTRGKKIKISPHQVSFHLKHASLGCPTFVLVEYWPPPTSTEKRQIVLYAGKDSEGILAHGIDQKPIKRAVMDSQGWLAILASLREAMGQ
jgi:hypothetical protein